jgi:hypothetical protein
MVTNTALLLNELVDGRSATRKIKTQLPKEKSETWILVSLNYICVCCSSLAFMGNSRWYLFSGEAVAIAATSRLLRRWCFLIKQDKKVQIDQDALEDWGYQRRNQ